MMRLKECAGYDQKIPFLALVLLSVGLLAVRENFTKDVVVVEIAGVVDEPRHQPNLDEKKQESEMNQVRKIFFLKTHKTGSSTVMNIVQRYGLKTKMRFALPKQQGQGQFYELLPIDGKMVLGWERQFAGAYDIICNHLLYAAEGVQEILGTENIFKFSVIREPISQYHSVFSYYTEKVPEFQLPNIKYSAADRLKFFVEHPLIWEDITESGLMFAFNPQLSQFTQLARSPYLTEGLINSLIAEIKREFDFVIILEYFDISLCVLRHKIGWSMNDIQYLKINSIYDKSSNGKTWLTENLQENFRKLNNGDILLYNIMNQTLWNEVEKLGKEKILLEAKELHLSNQKLEIKCANGTYKRKIWNGQQAVFPRLRASMKDNELCWGVTRQMVQFTNFLKMDYNRKYLA